MSEEPKKSVGDKVYKGFVEANKAVVNNPGHSVAGAIIGTVVIPIPFVGTAVGAYVGGWIGKKNSE